MPSTASPALLSIELTSPQSVDGRRAAFQSLWLLVRMQHAHAHGGGSGVVRLADLRGEVSDASTLRMVVSRAFRDFKAWGLEVGWGEDLQREPRFLNAERRSQGPFWLPAAQAKRLRLLVDNRPATAAEVTSFLGLRARKAQAAGAITPPDAVHLQDAAFWKQLVASQQAARQGRLMSPVAGGNGSALEAIRLAGTLAASDFQRALVTLNEAMLWRRLGDNEQARRRLQALKKQRLAHHVAGNDYLGAMECIVSAWCAYTARDLPLAQSLLGGMAQDPARALVLRHHPDVRFEWCNLWALACRSRALALAADDRPAAAALAEESLQRFGEALAAAFESHSFDAAQHVAANMGMAAWLFDRVGLGDLPALAHDGHRADTTRRAVQWIAFSEWLCGHTDGQGRSAWNAIYLMRIARGHCRPDAQPTLAQFRAQKPLDPAAVSKLAGPLADAFDTANWPARWVDVAQARLADHQAGRRRYPGLQQGSLLFEHAWYAAHAGDLKAAEHSLGLLREVLPQLVPSDRAYFTESWNDALPAELVLEAKPPRRPSAPRKKAR
ncbi:hypothetical protein J2W25_005958 [Variovorax boronicumulans]|uniref:Uncharacterized protein n=1 Tax=Variovorax boronicumulans TaxID=436515 RepID=A0AAW8E4U2_9BURK|nr:hypothetical protein [Variovorax boronicumulans]MDP9881779.1 hypothetical protein [Variovorax boronicumulans]MDP9914968.1 hypothetical protein [Variovorax boronicumulans]MDP9926908.1 hypothetical protein [Variovorax boronicumulans]